MLTSLLPLIAVQLGGQGLPDLSGISGAISGVVTPKPAGTFSSGLTVPSVHPGATAKGIGRQFRTTIEAKTGPNAGLKALEDGMPDSLAKMEAQLSQLGLAKRDLGVAMGYFFITSYETATGKTVPQDASLAAARTVAKATATRFGPRFRSLPPAQKESLYETMIVTPMVLNAFATQFAKAGKAADAQGMRGAAGDLFQKIVGTAPSAVSISADGRISGLAGGSSATTTTTPKGLPGGRLTASGVGGARVFVMYVVPINGSSPIDELVLFPDGTALDDLPSGPTAGFDVASVVAASRRPNVGRWSQSGNRLTVTIGRGKPDVYVKDPSGGWADPERKSGSFGIYFPALPLAPGALAGAWHSETIASVGVPGGAGPMTFGGSTGDLVFGKDGTYAKAGRGFASSSGLAGGGSVSALGKGRQSQGRWRLDGLMLTTVENGQRGVQLAYELPHWGHSQGKDIMIQGRRWSRK